MFSDQGESSSTERINLGADNLKLFFISHLNRIYCAKEHLIKMLPELGYLATFADLKQAIQETTEDVEKQLARMELIYELLDSGPSDESCNGLKGLIDDAFTAIQQQNTYMELRDLSILFYLQNIESVEMASFQVLRIAATKFRNPQIRQLLKENFEEAKADRTLLLLISAKYIIS